jgi:DNA-binding transcriptional LysR family regulator
MDTRFLESFITVLDQGSIAQAARRLNLTPAAVAQRLRTLESEIGARLVTRSGRTVRPTEAGAAILGRARELLGDVRDLKSMATSEVPSGELRLGAIANAISGILPPVLVRVTEKYPQLDIYIHRGTSTESYHRVLEGDLDAAVIVQPPFAIPKTCDWHVFRKEPLLVLAPASMANRDPHELLANEPFIRYDRNNWTGRLVDQYLRRVGIRPRERFELAGLEAVAALVHHGLGVALVPDWAPPWPEGLALAKLPIPDPSFTRRIGLIWTRDTARVRLIHTFIQEAATHAFQIDATRKHKRGKHGPRRSSVRLPARKA